MKVWIFSFNRRRLALVVFVGFMVLILGLLGLKKSPRLNRAAATPSPAQVGQCRTSTGGDQFRCYESYFNLVVQTAGTKEALRQLTDLNTKDTYVQAQCHALTHSIGRATYKRYGSVAAATKYASELCYSGVYHGIMEAYMSQFNDQQLMAKMPGICDPNVKPHIDYYNCLHGLGHGVTIRFDNDIFKAMPFCDALTDSWQRQSCYSGAFMQNIVVDDATHKSVNIKPDDPVYPCNAVQGEQKSPCYLMVTSNILKKVGWDYNQAFKICDGVEAGYVATCYMSMGRDISGADLLDARKVVDHCAVGGEANRTYCIEGAVANAVYFDRTTKNADPVCQMVEDRLKPDCRAYAQQNLAQYQ